MAFAWSGFTSPRQRISMRSMIRSHWSISACGTIGWPTPRAACAT
jgi:hypothetical protein